MSESNHKSGFVNIIGRPNVGKSSLMNALVGQKLSAATHKAQTTRHRIHGILNSEDYQIVFSDTPGIIKPAYKLQESMMDFVEGALEDADIFLVVAEPQDLNPFPESIINSISNLKVPVIVALNKLDTSDPLSIEAAESFWKSQLKGSEVLAISVLKKFNLEGLLNLIIEHLPYNPPYYPKDELSDKNVRFFVSEFIREKILINYRKEIPYSVEIVIENYTEKPDIDHISAIVYVEKESQKGIVIGPKGDALKQMATQSRIEIEKFLGKKVFLEILVKVKKDWRNNPLVLKQFGYKSK